MKKTNTKVPKKKKGRKPRVKPQTNMVQKVNVKINTMTPQVPQVRQLPPSVVSYPVIQPNSTNIIPHQLHRNPFDSVAFQEKLDTRINNLTDIVNQLSRNNRNNIRETLQPTPVREMINEEPVRETLQDNLIPIQESDEDEETNIVTPSETPRIRIPTQNREKWILDDDSNLTSNVTGEVLKGFRHLRGNEYINEEGIIYNARSKMLKKR